MPTREDPAALTRETLYEAVLGERFAALPQALRCFHGDPRGGRAQGQLRVCYGRGPLARLAAAIIRAPPPGDAVPVELRVELDPNDAQRERWIRRFGPRAMLTRQWHSGPHLVEQVSLSRVYFELRVDEAAGAMVFVQRRCTVLGVPLPAWLAPRVACRASEATGDARAWAIHVTLSMPVIGLVCEYTGEMLAQIDTA